MLGTWTFTLQIDKMPIILTIMILGFSCSNSSSVDNSVMTFDVTTVHNLSIEEYASNHEGSTYPITITLIDYEPESDFSGTVYTSKIGLSSITRNCFGGFDCFEIVLDSSYFPFESLVFSDLIINNSQMKGNFTVSGSTIDYVGFEFIASRKE